MRAPLLVALAALVGLCTAFSAYDQISFPTDIADPACIQACINRSSCFPAH